MKGSEKEFRKNLKQLQAIDLIRRKKEVLLEGGSRSGKTFIIIYVILVRAIKYPGTKHLCLRKHFNHIKLSLWFQTIPDVFKIAFPNVKFKENKSDWFIELENGSQIWIAGTDDKERIDKILGTEWATIHFNEISELPYSTYETIKTRLNPPKGVRAIALLDQNPGLTSHWAYQKYHKHLNPETKAKLSEKEIDSIGSMKMNPIDNVDNLNESYIDNLETLSEAKRRRFLEGEYGDETVGALWKISWINDNRIIYKPEKIIRLIVSIDPNVTDDKKVDTGTDEAGIISVGEYIMNNEKHYAVIRDDSTPGLSWGQVACGVYKDENADRVIGEVNQGGDLIEMNLRNYDKNISYDSVRATRGKEIRAEPVADLYRRGYVHHIGLLPELENELISWVPGSSRSPNRLDALVWGISYLAGIKSTEPNIRLI